MTLTPILLTIVLGALTGYTDLHSQEVQNGALVLVSAGWVLGALYPDGAWRRALLLGLSVPVAHLVSRVTGAALPYQVQNFPDTVLAVIPASIGTYAGVWMRRLVLQEGKQHPRG